MNERITAGRGIALLVEKRITDNAAEIAIAMEGGEKCLLHCGVRRSADGPWQMPPRSSWPEGSIAHGDAAVRIPLSEKPVVLRFDLPASFRFLVFALFFEKEDRWDTNQGKNYQIEIPRPSRPGPTPAQILEKEIDREKVSYSHEHQLDSGDRLAVAVSKEDGMYRVSLVTDAPAPLALHWGIAISARYEWLIPPASMRPAGTEVVQGAVRTAFVEKEGFRRTGIEVSEKEAPLGIAFVLVQDGGWIKDRGRNFYIPVVMPSGYEASLGSAVLSRIADEIVENETGRNSWTLMHRFNLCFDLLDGIGTSDTDGMALIFVWLRFSAIRQLDWQRNYNTKPRELGHAMDRLTLKLGARYAAEPVQRELIRLIMTTLGRGSNAQRVRDEVLNIMHRHNIKEVSGHFMEEWHQKLHNNTTPDDIAICEAYLEFLRSNGDIERFYNRLEEGGVTKERLESYERPIRSAPDYIPHLKDGLIRDFENFLGILKEVHYGTDLETAIRSAKYAFDTDMHGLADFIWAHRDDRGQQAAALACKITESRRRLASRLTGGQPFERDLLFLDIALEEFLRVVVERDLQADPEDSRLIEMISLVLENLTLSISDEEIEKCSMQWNSLNGGPRFERQWALRAKAVLDRLQRALGNHIDRCYKLLQPKAEFLGRAFHAARWTIDLFSEEVVRGRIEFALSVLLRLIDPVLRKTAHLGDWQIIGRGAANGKVEIVTTLKSVQGRNFSTPTVIVADHLAGDEEVPQGVVAIFTPAVIDILAHLSVRARNAGILFATCYEPNIISRLKALAGHFIKAEASAAGDIVFSESTEEAGTAPAQVRAVRPIICLAGFTDYAISTEDFTAKNVGGKSYNLKPLRGVLPDWINFPASAALPFGVCENVLSDWRNGDISRRYEELIRQLDDSGKEAGMTLSEIRNAVLSLNAPDGLESSLRVAMDRSGLSWPPDWDITWTCIKRVWASKWNKRAWLSRKAYGIRDEDLYMAVLIQRVVEADYSFVIHTVNPFTVNRNEIYAEVVLGLGEVLVGNYPGKSLSFTRAKRSPKELRLLSYPSKSVGLFGSGLIFRSDSNGEDLEGLAGAGLYDSFPLAPYRKVTLDYTADPLLKDEKFRTDFLNAIADIGILIEKALGSPQDIEGAYSRGKYFVVQTRPQVGVF